jgi:hypothetical protein
MITADNKLAVFEDFFIDENLKKKRESGQTPRVGPTNNKFLNGEVGGDDGDEISFINHTASGRLSFRGSGRDERVLYGEYLDYLLTANPTWKNKIRHKFAKLFTYRDKPMKNVIKYETIDNFFQNIKKAVADLNVEEKDLAFYVDAVNEAQENGQQALFEILKDMRGSLTRELALTNYAKRNKQSIKYVSEEDVVKFFKAVQYNGRFIKLTWMRNYTRTIPKKVKNLKNKFDEEGIFDNYVILHFDKAGDASQMTKKQKEKAKDPILFGMIRGSRKLYFIGDWVDEYCDLTLEKFLETISQEKAKTLTVTSIKKEVETTK